MIKAIYKATCLILFVALCAVLPSCAASYRTDVGCAELADTICAELGEQADFAAYGDEHLSLLVTDPMPADCAMRYARDSLDITEVAVLRAESAADAKGMEKALCAYVEETQEQDRAFLASYSPTELAKLEGAEVRRIGTYVILCICDPERLESCWDAAESLLRKA